MPDVSEFIKLIELVPNLILYIVPGFVLLFVLSFILCKELKIGKEYITVSLIISFIIINIEKFAFGFFYNYVDVKLPSFTIFAIIISMIIAYVLARFTKSKYMNKLFKTLKITRTTNHNIFADIKDEKYGSWMRIYMPSEKIVYLGTLRMFENNTNYEESFIVLSNYVTYPYADSPVKEECFVTEHKGVNWVAIKIKDISRIEIIYSEESEIVKESP